MHAEISGTVDFFEKSDEACLERLRALVELLPDSGPRTQMRGSDPARPGSDLYDLVSLDGRKEYDVRDVVACIVDRDSMHEYKHDYGQTLVCAYAAIHGRKVGIVASQRLRTKSPKGELQIGGVIYHDSADKAARFIMDCEQTRLPIIFFQDVTGFMVGRDSEQAGIIRAGAKLVNAVSNVTVPKITVIVGGSFGAGNYALCGKGFDPTFIFAWPSAKYAVMGGAQAANTLLQLEQRQAERLGKKLTDPEIASLRDRITKDYEHKTDIRFGAARGWVDAIIAPHRTRDVLATALDVATRPPPPGGFRSGVFQV
jgi:acetyl-CoA carboxylase carboxyltransferase component